MLRRQFATIALLAARIIAQPATASEWTKVLLPVSLAPVEGKDHVTWRGGLLLHNDGSTIARAFPTGGIIGNTGSGLQLFTVLQQSTVDVIAGANPADGRAVQLLYLESARADDIALQLFVAAFDGNRMSGLWEIPVIREGEFETGPVNLLGIPNRGEYRVSLRIYEVDAHTSSLFRVEIVDMQSPFGTVRDEVVTTRGPEFSTDVGPVSPGIFEWHSLESIPELSRISLFRLRITPLDPQTRFWAMVTLTNAANTQITTITPQ